MGTGRRPQGLLETLLVLNLRRRVLRGMLRRLSFSVEGVEALRLLSLLLLESRGVVEGVDLGRRLGWTTEATSEEVEQHPLAFGVDRSARRRLLLRRKQVLG